MFVNFFNHLRLTLRLLFDRRVRLWGKLFLVGLPMLYFFIPTPVDILPVIGLADDLLILFLSSLIFTHLCPPAVVAEHRQKIQRLAPYQFPQLDMARHPDEAKNLASGFAVIFLGMAILGWMSGLVGLALLVWGYLWAAVSRSSMLSNAIRVGDGRMDNLLELLQRAQADLPPVQANLCVVQNPVMNAYTFGFNEPYTIVLTSGLVEKLQPAEIQAVIGHELGHILFGHVRLINLLGGAYGPLKLLFMRWSRSCEYSADAVALRACQGQAAPVVSALVKLTSGLPQAEVSADEFLRQASNSEKRSGKWAEFLSTHPFMDHRIERLIQGGAPA